MSENIRLTVLVENSVNTRGLKAEHGLAFLIEIGGCRVLFDTGQTELLLDNARTLGCSLEGLDAIVLSHGHYDHTGGLAAVCRLSPEAQIFLHPAAMRPKFSGSHNGPARDIGMSEAGKQTLANAEKKVVPTTACLEVVEGLFVTGEIPRQTDFEDVGGKFCLDAGCQQPDSLVDDQALFFETPDGVVVLLGCAHAGVVNTLRHIERLTNGKRFHAVIGGMHLLHAAPARLHATIEALRRWNVSKLVPMHCTGLAAMMRLWAEFPNRCGSGGVGTQLVYSREPIRRAK
jgi:7,8-dihydropterin-6-yl-methyl-4-(beta-D-ribofuranosyl)aminobenzene 5'-phosphate synthase